MVVDFQVLESDFSEGLFYGKEWRLRGSLDGGEQVRPASFHIDWDRTHVQDGHVKKGRGDELEAAVLHTKKLWFVSSSVYVVCRKTNLTYEPWDCVYCSVYVVGAP